MASASTSSSWIVTQSQHALKQRIYSHSKQKLKDNIKSKDVLPRRLKFVKPKKQQNARPMSACSTASSSPPSIARHRSGFNAASVQLFAESNIPQLMAWQKSVPSVGGGLRNLGNSCFMNATLQCLCYTAPFQNYISSQHHTKHCKTSGYCIFCQLQTLMPSMLHSQSASVPRTIFKNLRLLSKKLRPGRQEDAQEFLRFLMEGLQNSCLRQEARKICDMRVSETTFIHKLWGGYLRSQIKCCRCGHESNTYDSILDISLEIRGPSLRSAFKHFTDPEVLDDDNKYQCDHCQKKRRAVKQFTIFEAPNVLVVHLKRFESGGGGAFSGGKINAFIKFEACLDITEYMSYQVCPTVSYSLIGALVHYGYSSHGGHYVSYVKAADGSWYLMDDARCQRIADINVVLKEKAYLLFYQRNEAKVLYKSPSASPKMKNIGSISSLDSLRELAEFLPKRSDSALFAKRRHSQTITESPELCASDRSRSASNKSTSPSLGAIQRRNSKNKTMLAAQRSTKPLIGGMGTDTPSPSADIAMKRSGKEPADAASEWQQTTNCGAKRKHSLGNDAQCKASKSPAKRRKLNGDKSAQIKALKLLKERISSRRKSVSSSASPSLNNVIYGRRSYPLFKRAAKSTLQSSPKKIYKPWNRKLLRRATQIPSTSINNLHKCKRQSPHAILSDSSSESVLSDNKAIVFCDESSSSISPELGSATMKNVNKYRISSTSTGTAISIDAYLCDSDSRMCAIGIGDVGKWSDSIGCGTADNVRNSIIEKSKRPIVAPKDEWDLALDSGAAYPHKSKQKSDPFKHFNRKEYVNQFQLSQNDKRNGIGSFRKFRKRGNFHNDRSHYRRRKNTFEA